jgi:Xaa-Pro dipeptidase
MCTSIPLEMSSQDSWFNYVFGVKETGFFGAIALKSRKSTLFIPRLAPEYEIFCGKIYPPSYFRDLYDVDDVFYSDDLLTWLTATLEAEGADAKVHLMSGVNSDSGLSAKPAKFEGVLTLRDAGKVCEESLHHIVSTARITKVDSEIVAMWYSSLVASNAHVEVMRSAKAGMVEYELEARFLYEIYKNGGCRKCAYTSICACGPNNATLHYGHAGAPNDRTIQENDMLLLDMGADYHGYVSDITCSFPVSGIFNDDQRAIFEGVLSAQRAVLEAMKPGSSWVDCHKLAEREIIRALQSVGVIRSGFTIDELAVAGIGGVFFPHGLGHLIGCDTHDVGGYLTDAPPRPDGPGGVKKLRTARTLQAGMVLTNEPGCYFIEGLVKGALADPIKSAFLDPTILTRFEGFGGVRLEDVVVVTPEGPVNLTTCPRTINEIESVIAGGPWPPLIDEAPYLFRRWGELAPGGVGMLDIVLGK